MTLRLTLVHACNPLHVYCRVMDLCKWYERRVWPAIRKLLRAKETRQ